MNEQEAKAVKNVEQWRHISSKQVKEKVAVTFDVTKNDDKLWKSRNLHRSAERDIVEAW